MQTYVNRLEVLFAKVWPKSFDSPLVRNGYSLVASAGITSVLGLVFWMIAARLFTPAELGISVGLLSALLTIGQIGQLNFGNVLNRFLPVAGRRTANIIVFSFACAALLAAPLRRLDRRRGPPGHVGRASRGDGASVAG